MKAVVDFPRHRAGLVSRPEYSHVDLPRERDKASPFSSYQKIVETIRPGSVVLDVGCGRGEPARNLRKKGGKVIGVDSTFTEEARHAWGFGSSRRSSA